MTTRSSKQTTFNMIEIVLALVIIVIGVIGVMALFPVGQKAQRTAMATNNAQDASEQFMRVFSSKVKERWALLAALPLSNPGEDVDDSNIAWQNSDSNDVFHAIQGIDLQYFDEDNDGKFDFQITDDDQSLDDSGVFKITQRSAGNIEDFSAILRVWHAPAMYKSYNKDTGHSGWQAASRERGIQLNVELSWPAAIPYAKRETARFSQVVFRPTEETTTQVDGAFRISQSGQLKFTYYASEAGYKNGFYMIAPEEVEIFESQAAGAAEQTRILEGEYGPGTTFNFYGKVQPNWNNPNTTWNHYAWADPASAVGDGTPVSKTDSLGFSTEITEVEKVGGGHRVTLTVSSTASVQHALSHYSVSVPDALRGDVVDTVSNSRGWPVEEVNPDPTTGIRGFKIDETELGEDGAIESFTITYTIDGDDVPATTVASKAAGANATVTFDPADFASVAPATVESDIPYYDSGDSTNRDGAHDLLSGNPYCVVTELIPGRKWLMGFEDVPGYYSWTDWDYNDIVVSAELLMDDGVVVSSLGSHTVDGRIKLQDSGHRDWRVTIIKPDGSAIETKSLGSGYVGEAIALWARPQGSGSQTITVDGDEIEWQNANMIVVASVNMEVDVKKVSNKWVCDVDATEADFSIMQ